MNPKNLEVAFTMTREEHSATFERFANAFMVPDYPELEALGGKKDKGMDARIVKDSTGKPILVVQSCVSPASTARTKILGTVKKLEEPGIPPTILYCTSAKIGLSLDKTKNELWKDRHVSLIVHDAEWFCQRAISSPGRTLLCEKYANEILNPLLKDVKPESLYSGVLSEEQERVTIQYLEAQNTDNARNRNFTKTIFDSLIVYALRDASPQNLFTEAAITDSIVSMFPDGHAARIREIIPPRIQFLIGAGTLKHHTKENAISLHHTQKQRLSEGLQRSAEREISFRSELYKAIISAADHLEIDYEFDPESLSKMSHNLILWFLHQQGIQFRDAVGNLLNILNTEDLLNSYLAASPLGKGNVLTSEQIAKDILPSALYSVLNSNDPLIQAYLRSKADLFILEAFLQATPDVQKACKMLFGNDVIYLDTTVLIRCIAEKYSTEGKCPLLTTLRNARELGIKLRTFHQYPEELVAHLQGPILLEWANHAETVPSEQMDSYLIAAPTLIGVFHRHAIEEGTSVESIVADIIGINNGVENTIQYLAEEFGIETEIVPPRVSDVEKVEWEKIFGFWYGGKRKWPNMKIERFELLVRNDVNAFYAIIQHRRKIKFDGKNYGHKVWLLTLDRMSWKIPAMIGKAPEQLYNVAMGTHYLVNFVSTLAQMGTKPLPDGTMPAVLLIGDALAIPQELRDMVTKELVDHKQKRYLIDRKIRDLVHNMKSSWEETSDDKARATNFVDVTPDEAI